MNPNAAKRGRPNGDGSKSSELFLRDLLVLSLFDETRPNNKYSSAMSEVVKEGRNRYGLKVSRTGIRRILKTYRGKRRVSLVPGPVCILGSAENEQIREKVRRAAKTIADARHVKALWYPPHELATLPLRIDNAPRTPLRSNARSN